MHWVEAPDGCTFVAYAQGQEVGHVWRAPGSKVCFVRLKDGTRARATRRQVLNLSQAQLVLLRAWRAGNRLERLRALRDARERTAA